MEEALRRVRVAEGALAEGAYAYCIRQSQEAVEPALKAALRLVGIEPPKWHDVGPVLLDNRGRFPKWFDERIEEAAATSRWLRREREPSMYGDEESGLPPQTLHAKLRGAGGGRRETSSNSSADWFRITASKLPPPPLHVEGGLVVLLRYASRLLFVTSTVPASASTLT